MRRPDDVGPLVQLGPGKLDILGLASQAIEIEIDYQFRRNIVRDSERIRHRLYTQPIGPHWFLEYSHIEPAVATGRRQAGHSSTAQEGAGAGCVAAERKRVGGGGR